MPNVCQLHRYSKTRISVKQKHTTKEYLTLSFTNFFEEYAKMNCYQAVAIDSGSIKKKQL